MDSQKRKDEAKLLKVKFKDNGDDDENPRNRNWARRLGGRLKKKDLF
ncbi:MAG: hypothetical protein ACTSUE_27170 [Promethearchaeota archaeon]